jgi:hypothetical protein
MSALGRWRSEVGDTHVLGLVRVVIGCLLFWHALVAARELESIGYTGAAFHVPMVPEVLVPSGQVYTVLVAVRLLLAVLVAIGYAPRMALLASAALALHAIVIDRAFYHHNRYALACFAFLLAFAPCDRSFVITGQPTTATSRAGDLWAARLAQAQLSIIYLASGLSKLADDDWRDGRVLGDRFFRYAYQAIERGVPRGVDDLLSQPSMTSARSKTAIACSSTGVPSSASSWSRPRAFASSSPSKYASALGVAAGMA